MNGRFLIDFSKIYWRWKFLAHSGADWYRGYFEANFAWFALNVSHFASRLQHDSTKKPNNYRVACVIMLDLLIVFIYVNS